MPRKKKTDIENAVIEETVDVNKEGEQPVETVVTENVSKAEPEKKRGRKKKEEIIEPSETAVEGTGEEKPKRKRKAKTEVDEKTRDTLVLLKGAKATCSILNGVIERIDDWEKAPTPETRVCAILHFGNFKVMIPAAYMKIKAKDVSDDTPVQEKVSKIRKRLNTLLGASVDYVVTHIDSKNNIAIGNRDIACNIQIKKGFENKYRNSGKSLMEYNMENKIPVEGDILAVSGSQILMSVYGAECKVVAKDAAWRFSNNLSENFYPGEKVKVIIKDIKRGEDPRDITVIGSIKDTTANPQIDNLSDFSVNSTCLGRVSGAIDRGYFLVIGTGESAVEAFCDLVHGGITPQVGDIVSCQFTAINYETGQAKAKITRIIRRANSNQYL